MRTQFMKFSMKLLLNLVALGGLTIVSQSALSQESRRLQDGGTLAQDAGPERQDSSSGRTVVMLNNVIISRNGLASDLYWLEGSEGWAAFRFRDARNCDRRILMYSYSSPPNLGSVRGLVTDLCSMQNYPRCLVRTWHDHTTAQGRAGGQVLVQVVVGTLSPSDPMARVAIVFLRSPMNADRRAECMDSFEQFLLERE